LNSFSIFPFRHLLKALLRWENTQHVKTFAVYFEHDSLSKFVVDGKRTLLSEIPAKARKHGALGLALLALETVVSNNHDNDYSNNVTLSYTPENLRTAVRSGVKKSDWVSKLFKGKQLSFINTHDGILKFEEGILIEVYIDNKKIRKNREKLRHFLRDLAKSRNPSLVEDSIFHLFFEFKIQVSRLSIPTFSIISSRSEGYLVSGDYVQTKLKTNFQTFPLLFWLTRNNELKSIYPKNALKKGIRDAHLEGNDPGIKLRYPSSGTQPKISAESGTETCLCITIPTRLDLTSIQISEICEAVQSTSKEQRNGHHHIEKVEFKSIDLTESPNSEFLDANHRFDIPEELNEWEINLVNEIREITNEPTTTGFNLYLLNIPKIDPSLS